MNDLVLPSSFDITVVDAVAAESSDGGITVDGSAVTRIDAIGLQFLVSRAARQSLAWKAFSAVIVEGANVLGLASILGLPVATKDQ